MPESCEARLDAEFEAAIRRGVFSGASLLVARDRKVVFESVRGSVERGGAPVCADVRFDLASLTKALVTAPLFMRAVEAGSICLDDSLRRFFPGRVPEDKRSITARSLLSHTSGLPAYAPFYLELVKLPPEKRREALASMLLETPLENPPGKAANYSDLGFMLLGLILERQTGRRLDFLAREFLFSPLGIDELHFRPPTGAAGAFAATQSCPWRKRLLRGEVDDENAWALDGVAGHAGLFGTARGVFELLSHLWGIYENDVTSRPSPPISPETLRLFWTRTGLGDWCLGYDTPSPEGYCSAGRFFSSNTVGHLGFTGVSFWLDLQNRVLMILLTNRVHPTRQNDEIRQFRPVIHDIVMKALLYGN